MPDVPQMDFVGSMAEIWIALNCAAYHLACVFVYTQTAALQTRAQDMARLAQDLRNKAQADLVICRAHLAAFFWQLDHVFEALEISVKRGQKEQPTEEYFWSFEKALKKIEQDVARKEINAYRNKAHTTPSIIGIKWTAEHKFVHHFLPYVNGLSKTEDIELHKKLQEYFEYTANIWLSFAPSELKKVFPRDFSFVVSVPYSYLGEIPSELQNLPQLEIHIQAHDKISGGATAPSSGVPPAATS